MIVLFHLCRPLETPYKNPFGGVSYCLFVLLCVCMYSMLFVIVQCLFHLVYFIFLSESIAALLVNELGGLHMHIQLEP